jgi:hypothetical protein
MVSQRQVVVEWRERRACGTGPAPRKQCRDLRNEAIAWASHWLTSFHHDRTGLPLATAALGHTDAEGHARAYDDRRT